MNLQAIIYLAETVDTLKFSLIVIGGFPAIVFGVFLLLQLDPFFGLAKFSKKIKQFLTLGLITVFLGIFIPNGKTIYLMTGVSLAKDAIATPEAAKARQALNLGLDKIISNLKESGN